MSNGQTVAGSTSVPCPTCGRAVQVSVNTVTSRCHTEAPCGHTDDANLELFWSQANQALVP